ncbi:MAG: aldehyde ferredoxin oxidoreductase family protein [Desulfobacterota bacterium]|nr:aldehyde ferredoxin oxidoreductase family protein [Thermodesulfobacteriota bacterium]
MYGWCGQRLRVDLSKGTIIKEPLSYEYRRKWIGGRGMNSEVIYREVPPNLDPFDPDARVCFGVGPISGTAAPASGRVTVSCKSPLTGGFGDSNMGGHWGAELKYAGYDQIIVQGRAPKPVYIWIDDDNVEIRDARHLWGKFPREADAMIKQELGDEDIHIVVIGPAGENLVRFASTFNDVYRAAGRTGHGAVIGSKNLKAIAVRGSGTVKIARPKEFFDVCNRLRQKFKTDPMRKFLYEIGSLSLINVANHDGWLSVNNFKQGAHPEAWRMSGEEHSKTVLKHREGCFACPICCGRFTEIKEGKYAGEYGGGPEYEHSVPTGPRVGVFDPNAIWHNMILTNNYGMDGIETGGVIATAMEWYEKGLITSKDTGGLELTWGNQEVVEKLITMIAMREGFGDVLADGASRAADRLGLGDEGHKYTIATRGMTLPGDDPRGLGFAYGVGFAIGTRGGCDHLRCLASLELSGFMYPGLNTKILGDERPVKPTTTVGKGYCCFYEENQKAMVDCLNVCCFTTHWSYAVLTADQVDYFNAVTGMDITEEEFMEIGERIVNLERAYWARLLSGKREDTIPERFQKEPMPKSVDGQTNVGYVFPVEKILPGYYKYRDYDPDTGFPSERRLKMLGLEDVAKDLAPLRAKYNSESEKKKKKYYY